MHEPDGPNGSTDPDLPTITAKMHSDTELLIAGYLSVSAPVQWVGWWYALDASNDPNPLSPVLFPDGESLADLTDHARRLEVFRCVTGNTSLRRAVLDEVTAAIASQPGDHTTAEAVARELVENGAAWIETVENDRRDGDHQP